MVALRRGVIPLRDHCLPLSVNPFEDESGMGLCLRATTKNGGRLSALRRVLQIGEHEQFKQAHAPFLSQVLGIDHEILSRILPSMTGKGAGVRVGCYGHQFRMKAMLRTRNPQICAMCIREHGYARAEWDISLSSVCLEHDVGLVEHCPRCHARIRWDRPAMDWGHCGHQLAVASTNEAIDRDHQMAQSILNAALWGRQAGEVIAVAGFFPWLAGLSLDGWGNILWAAGIRDRPQGPVPKGTFARTPSTCFSRQLVAQGMKRLVAWSRGELATAEMAALTSEAPLIGAVLRPATTADREITLCMYSMLFGDGAGEALKRRLPNSMQLELF